MSIFNLFFPFFFLTEKNNPLNILHWIYYSFVGIKDIDFHSVFFTMLNIWFICTILLWILLIVLSPVWIILLGNGIYYYFRHKEFKVIFFIPVFVFIWNSVSSLIQDQFPHIFYW